MSDKNKEDRINRNLQKFLSLQQSSLQTDCCRGRSKIDDRYNHKKLTLGQIRGKSFMFACKGPNRSGLSHSALSFFFDALEGFHVSDDTLDSALDRDIRDLISPELQPIAPQPNCPQSMRIYQDSRMVSYIFDTTVRPLQSAMQGIFHFLRVNESYS